MRTLVHLSDLHFGRIDLDGVGPLRDAILAAIQKGEMPPQKTALGGEIYIHGGGIERDWTWGCVALKNEEIEELFAAIPAGTKVTILP